MLVVLLHVWLDQQRHYSRSYASGSDMVDLQRFDSGLDGSLAFRVHLTHEAEDPKPATTNQKLEH